MEWCSQQNFSIFHSRQSNLLPSGNNREWTFRFFKANYEAIVHNICAISFEWKCQVQFYSWMQNEKKTLWFVFFRLFFPLSREIVSLANPKSLRRIIFFFLVHFILPRPPFAFTLCTQVCSDTYTVSKIDIAIKRKRKRMVANDNSNKQTQIVYICSDLLCAITINVMWKIFVFPKSIHKIHSPHIGART